MDLQYSEAIVAIPLAIILRWPPALSTDRRWPRQKRDSEAFYCAEPNTLPPPGRTLKPHLSSCQTQTPPPPCNNHQLLPFLPPRLHARFYSKFFYIYILPISQYHYSLLYSNCLATLAHFTVFLLLVCLAHRPVNLPSIQPFRLLTAPCVPQTLRCTTARVAPLTYRLPDDLLTSR